MSDAQLEARTDAALDGGRVFGHLTYVVIVEDEHVHLHADPHRWRGWRGGGGRSSRRATT